jgi:hypothetical protein
MALEAGKATVRDSARADESQPLIDIAAAAAKAIIAFFKVCAKFELSSEPLHPNPTAVVNSLSADRL